MCSILDHSAEIKELYFSQRGKWKFENFSATQILREINF